MARCAVRARLSYDCSSVCRACSRTALSKNAIRSEEHTSELQSQSNLVCRLLLEKKKKKNTKKIIIFQINKQTLYNIRVNSNFYIRNSFNIDSRSTRPVRRSDQYYLMIQSYVFKP